MNSGRAATIVFNNCTNKDYEAFLIDYAGKPVRYKIIPAGRRTEQPTFVTHKWNITNRSGDYAAIVVTLDEAQQMQLTHRYSSVPPLPSLFEISIVTP
jgi:hypothetical protein